jgi:hypothetical protein
MIFLFREKREIWNYWNYWITKIPSSLSKVPINECICIFQSSEAIWFSRQTNSNQTLREYEFSFVWWMDSLLFPLLVKASNPISHVFFVVRREFRATHSIIMPLKFMLKSHILRSNTRDYLYSKGSAPSSRGKRKSITRGKKCLQHWRKLL